MHGTKITFFHIYKLIYHRCNVKYGKRKINYIVSKKENGLFVMSV